MNIWNLWSSVFENINYAALDASSNIAKGKRQLRLTLKVVIGRQGRIFDKEVVYGFKALEEAKRQGCYKTALRNGYTSWLWHQPVRTCIIAGYHCGFRSCDATGILWKKRKTALIPRVAPDLSMETFWYYKNAHTH